MTPELRYRLACLAARCMEVEWLIRHARDTLPIDPTTTAAHGFLQLTATRLDSISTDLKGLV